MIECDVCGQPATILHAPSPHRHLMVYCVDDDRRFISWPEEGHPITEAERAVLEATPDRRAFDFSPTEWREAIRAIHAASGRLR